MIYLLRLGFIPLARVIAGKDTHFGFTVSIGVNFAVGICGSLGVVYGLTQRRAVRRLKGSLAELRDQPNTE